MAYIYHYLSPLGKITMSSGGEAITGLWFEGQKYYGSTIKNAKIEEKKLYVFESAEKWLDIYFGGREPGFIPLLQMEATPFRRLIWEILLTVPYGKTVTYKELAEKAAVKMGLLRMSPQAVGGAVGHNPIAIIVPCHRVIGSDGSLTGYAGGIERKKKLLQLETLKL